MLNPNSTTPRGFCCNTCGAPVAMELINADDLVYQCQNRQCQRSVSIDCPEALQVREVAQVTAHATFDTLCAAFDTVFAELYAVDGDTAQVGDARMEAMNVQWFEVLAEARWTPGQWTMAVNRAARLAA